MHSAARVILAIDPGRSKCGAAVCAPGEVLARAVLAPEALPALIEEWQRQFAVTEIVVGNRTGAQAVLDAIRGTVRVPLAMAEEAGTTLRARARYFAEHPPRGWRRLLPQTLQTPPEPVDDYVAVLLAEAALAGTEGGRVREVGRKESNTKRRRES